MTSFITKNFPNVLMVSLIAGTMFVAVFRIVAIQNERDLAGINVRRGEVHIANLQKEIREQQTYRDQISNATTLRRSADVQENFREVADSQIIRVRTMKVPYGRSNTIDADPRTNALDLAMLTSRYSRAEK